MPHYTDEEQVNHTFNIRALLDRGLFERPGGFLDQDQLRYQDVFLLDRVEAAIHAGIERDEAAGEAMKEAEYFDPFGAKSL